MEWIDNFEEDKLILAKGKYENGAIILTRPVSLENESLENGDEVNLIIQPLGPYSLIRSDAQPWLESQDSTEKLTSLRRIVNQGSRIPKDNVRNLPKGNLKRLF